MMNEQAFVRTLVVQLVQCIFDLSLRNGQAQMVTGDIWNRVSFVQDHGVIVWQKIDSQFSQSQIAEKQRVIDHDYVRILQTFSGAK